MKTDACAFFLPAFIVQHSSWISTDWWNSAPFCGRNPESTESGAFKESNGNLCGGRADGWDQPRWGVRDHYYILWIKGLMWISNLQARARSGVTFPRKVRMIRMGDRFNWLQQKRLEFTSHLKSQLLKDHNVSLILMRF